MNQYIQSSETTIAKLKLYPAHSDSLIKQINEYEENDCIYKDGRSCEAHNRARKGPEGWLSM